MRPGRPCAATALGGGETGVGEAFRERRVRGIVTEIRPRRGLEPPELRTLKSTTMPTAGVPCTYGT